MNGTTKVWQKWVAAAGLVSALSIGALAVSAQDTTIQANDPAAGLFQQGGSRGDGPGPGRGGRGGDRLAEWAEGRFLIEQAAAATGLTAADIRAALADDVTLAQIITDAGADPAAVLTGAVDAATTRINALVALGRLTQAEADALLADLNADFTAWMNQSVLENRIIGRADNAALRLAADYLSVDRGTLRAELAAGQSLGALLTAGGVDLAAFTDDLVTRTQARLNVLVVDGDITQERADALLSRFRAELETVLSSAAADASL